MSTRYYALVGEIEGPLKARHAVGLPPELTGGKDETVTLPTPHVLILREDQDIAGTWTLYRYAEDGQFGGDTWHEEIEHAREQARFEYGEALGDWHEIPEDVTDEVAYALSQIPPPSQAKETNPTSSSIESVRRLFSGRTFSDSAELIREDRDR